MTASSLALFAASLGIACASPGPAVMAVSARVLSGGASGVARFCAGIVLADLLWLSCASMGMAAVTARAPWLLLGLKIGGALYLAMLAVRLFRAPPPELGGDGVVAATDRPFLGGLFLGVGNPKAILFYLALLPTVVDLSGVGPRELLLVAVVAGCIVSGVLAGYALVAMRARAFFRSPVSMRWMQKTCGVIMAAAAVLIATR